MMLSKIAALFSIQIQHCSYKMKKKKTSICTFYIKGRCENKNSNIQCGYFHILLLYFGRVPDTNFNRSLYLTIYEEKFNVKFAN